MMYSNLDDLDTQITYRKEGDAHHFRILTHLVDSKQQPLSSGTAAAELHYIFRGNELTIQCTLPEALRQAGVKFCYGRRHTDQPGRRSTETLRQSASYQLLHIQMLRER